jgi:hypothetical protein
LAALKCKANISKDIIKQMERSGSLLGMVAHALNFSRRDEAGGW